MFGLGFGELVLIFLIALIFIGPKKLPELAKGLGHTLKEFQKAAKGFSDQVQDTDRHAEQTPVVTHETVDADGKTIATTVEPAADKKEDQHS